MGARTSAGLVMYRQRHGCLEVLLMHPGGPFHVSKDEGHWTIPKGEVEAGEELLEAAKREFEEETSLRPVGPFLPLGSIRQKGGKIVHAWGFAGDCEPAKLKSNTYRMEWPPGSGRFQEFPEMDRGDFFGMESARRKVKPAQIPLLDELERLLDTP